MRHTVRMGRHRIAYGALVAVLLLALSGCGGEQQDDTITVLAAASLSDVFEELATEFEAAHEGASVTFSFGSSTDLAEQVAEGAPGDVLATADETSMSLAEDAEVTGPPARPCPLTGRGTC